MNDDQVREKLREAFRTLSLPRTLPSPHLNGDEAITINGGRGRLCSVCGEIIPSNAGRAMNRRFRGVRSRVA